MQNFLHNAVLAGFSGRSAKGVSLGVQRERIEAYTRAKGGLELAEVLADEGLSGKRLRGVSGHLRGSGILGGPPAPGTIGRLGHKRPGGAP